MVPTWKEFTEQTSVIRSAPIPFVGSIVFLGVLMFIGFNFSYKGVIDNKDATIQAKQSEIVLYKIA
jgi:hypothetical protein